GRFDLSYALDYRGSQAAGHLALQQLELAVAMLHIGRLRPTLSASVGRFDASRYPADRFLFAGAGLDLRLELSEAFRVSAGYRVELRSFPGRADERDVVHLAELRVAYRPHSMVEVGAGTAFL